MADPVETIRRDWEAYKAKPGAFFALAVICCTATFLAVRWYYEADIRHLQVHVEELKEKVAAPNSPQRSEAEQKAVGQKVDQVLTEIAKARSEGGPDKQQKLDVIEEDFSVWAQKFQETRSAKLAALDRSKMRARVEEIQVARAILREEIGDQRIDHGDAQPVDRVDRIPVIDGGAAERVDGETEAGAANGVHVNDIAQVVDVGQREVLLVRRVRVDSIGECCPLYAGIAVVQ